MGDLNARLPAITGDTGVKHNNKNGVMLKSLLKDTCMSVCINKAQQEENKHWTFHNPTKKGDRPSVPDYILYPRANPNLCQNYKVHQSVACRSFHRLLTVEVNHSLKTVRLYGTQISAIKLCGQKLTLLSLNNVLTDT
jgi:hypothetical protein